VLHVPEFSDKLKLAIVAIRRDGQAIASQKTYAIKIFPRAKASGSADAMFSACKHGKKNFPADRLEVLISVIDPGRILKRVRIEEWMGPARAFKEAMLREGLIDTSDCEPETPLSDRLCAINDSEALMRILKASPRTYDTANNFEAALSRMVERERLRFEERLHEVTTTYWQSQAHRHTVGRASALLARMATCTLTHYGLKKVVEKQLACSDPQLALIYEPLCFVSIHHDEVGPFIKNVELMIEDGSRRHVEHEVQTAYYGGVAAAAWHILKHLKQRAAHVGAHDVGRTISVYPYLAKDRNRRDVAMALKEGTLGSLKELGIRSALRRKAERLMSD
jgi:hypothetical protein